MKKRLFYLAAFICCAGVLASCSKDNPDNSWKNIPGSEISGANATLTLNGQNVPNASVQMSVQNAEQGVLNLKNMIDGYASIPVNVTLSKQQDNSFNFTGEANVNSAPTAKSTPAILNVKVSGNISTDGKAKVEVTASGLGLQAGTYSEDKLVLKYSEKELIGKSVTSIPTDGATLKLVLNGIVPGEPAAEISVQPDASGAFSGNATSTGGAAIAYTGSLVNGVMNLNINATLSDAALGGLVGTWPLSRKLYNAQYAIEDSPFFLNWPAANPDDKNQLNGEQTANVASALLSHMLAEVLKDVTFQPDGNIVASYYPTIEMNGQTFQQWMMGHVFAMSINISERNWITSPTNLAFWYTKGDKLYIRPDISMILKQVASNSGGQAPDLSQITAILETLKNADDATLVQTLTALGESLGVDLSGITPAQIKQVLGWLETGVPLNYKAEGGKLQIYVDKEMISPFMPVVLSLMPGLQAKLDELAASEPLIQMLPILLGVTKLTDYETIWNTNTADFELGLLFIQ